MHKELNWSPQKTNRVVDLAEKGYTAEGIDKETGCGQRNARRIWKLVHNGMPVRKPRATYAIHKLESHKKLKPDTSQRKMRTCNGPRCGKRFMSTWAGHRNCGCMSYTSCDLQMLYA